MKSNGKGKGKSTVLETDNVDDDEFETQGFETNEDDGDDLWDVVEILAERGRRFLIKWAGSDSDGNPWPDSWVPREDVTDDLVSEWKAKKAAKKKGGRKKKETEGRRKKDTATSSRTTSAETASTSTIRRMTRDSTVGRTESISTTTTAQSSPTKRRKRSVSDDELSPSVRHLRSHDLPRKKRKLEVQLSQTPCRDKSVEKEGRRKGVKAGALSAIISKAGRSLSPELDGIEKPRLKTRSSHQDKGRAEHRIPSPDLSEKTKTNKRLSSEMPYSQQDDDIRDDGGGETQEGGEGREHVDFTSLSKKLASKFRKPKPLNIQPEIPVKRPRTDVFNDDTTQRKPTNLYDRLPTPPLRKKSRPRHAGNDISVDAQLKTPALDRHRVTSKTAKEPPERPEPLISTNQREDEDTLEDVEESRIPMPDSPLDHLSSRLTLQHSKGRVSPTSVAASFSEVHASNDGSPPRHVEEESGRKPLSSKQRELGVLVRMKKRGKNVDGVLSGSGSETKTRSKSHSQTRTTEQAGVDGEHLPAHRSSTPLFLPDIEDSTLPGFQQEGHDDGIGSEHDLHDQELLLSGSNGLLEEATVSTTVDDSIEDDAQASTKEPMTMPSASTIVQEEHVVCSQSSAGVVIPATQSQSQSQPQPQSQSQPEASAQPDSMLAEHGSSAPQVEEDASLEEAAPSSSIRIEADSIEITSPSFIVTDSIMSTGPQQKELKSIPVVTPSKFRDHLPSYRPLANIPLVQLQHMKRRDGVDTDAQMSSIDPQESPVKDFDADARIYEQRSAATRRAHDVTRTDDDDEIEDSMPLSLELRQRGLELTEIHREKVQRATKEIAGSRISLDAILGHATERVRSKPNSAGQPLSKTKVVLATELVHSNRNASPYLVKGAPVSSRPMVEDADDEALVRQFEEEYIDFDGNAGASSSADKSPNVGSAEEDSHGDQLSATSESGAYEEVDGDAGSSVHESVIGNEHDDRNDVYTGAASTTTTSQQDEEFPKTPTRSKILGSPHKFDLNVIGTPVRQLNSALGLLNRKSEEIASLKALHAEIEIERSAQQDRIAGLEVENAVLKKKLENQPELATFADAIEDDLGDLKDAHTTALKERDALLAEVSLLKMSRDDAEKNANLFRQLYSKVSSFADDLKLENAELTDRATLAEGQLSKGLEILRAQSANQVHKLSEELDKARILLSVFRGKDERTDDEVRRRAAREVELQPLIDELRVEIREVQSELSTVVRQRNELMVQNKDVSEELDKMRAENAVLNDRNWGLDVELARLSARERWTIKMFQQTSTGLDDDSDAGNSSRGEEEVFVCEWTSTDNSAERCGEVLASQQDLRDHLFLAGHV